MIMEIHAHHMQCSHLINRLVNYIEHFKSLAEYNNSILNNHLILNRMWRKHYSARLLLKLQCLRLFKADPSQPKECLTPCV